jgi:hypothetical protein
MINSRNIFIQQGEDILRWGHSTTGTFNLKEAYFLSAGHDSLPKDTVWNKIWGAKLWPKISTFLWLTVHNSILTWDNLTKRGFTGPSWCPLCCNEEETQNHLLNLCPFSSQLWDQCTSIMRTSDRNHSSLRETIEWMARLNFSLSHPQSDLAASPLVHSLAGLERKEQTNLQLLLNELARSMVQNPLQRQGNNQSSPLDGTRFFLPAQ